MTRRATAKPASACGTVSGGVMVGGSVTTATATPEPDLPRFRASGSSVIRLIVIGHRQPGHTVPCCFLIVTVSMQGLKVVQRILSPKPFGDKVVDFYQVLISKVVSTPGAFALLLSEDFSVSGLGEGMLGIPFCPISQPSIIG